MDKQTDTNNAPTSRTVRVFISSTFQDMKEERDHLVKVVFPELREHLDCSVTELEILHGVLNNPNMLGRAFFYFRDSSYVNNTG